MSDKVRVSCPDCRDHVSRREFVKTIGGTALAAGAVLPWVSASGLLAAPSPESSAETTVKRFYESLNEDQKKAICFPFEHQLRHRISANWAITEPSIGDEFYTADQRVLIDQILREVTSGDGYERLKRQMEADDNAGLNGYHVAVFGQPGSGKFQWELTGRHLTLRADGDSAENVAFGGPIVYGHGAENPSQNLFHYQTKKTNEVFQALNPDQAKAALLPKSPPENRVPIQGAAGSFPGISVGDLSADQQELVESAIKVILGPYRQEDVDEVLAILKQTGGLQQLHMAFYEDADLENDKVWDVWRMEGPGFVWHFRGAPHVHAYINIGLKA